MEEVNLPSGFAFSPTDVELVEGYLIPKLKGQKLPSNYVVDLKNIYQYAPHHLPYKSRRVNLMLIILTVTVIALRIFPPLRRLVMTQTLCSGVRTTKIHYVSEHARENEAYFFTSDDLTKNYEGNIRDTPGGYWEVERHRDKVEIYCAGEVIGFKTRLLFYNNINIEEEDFTNCNNMEENSTNWKMIQFRCHPSRIPTATHTTENYIVCKIKLRMKEDGVEEYVEVISEDENDTNGGNF